MRIRLTTKAVVTSTLLLLCSKSVMATGYAAVWQPGSGEQRWRSGMTVAGTVEWLQESQTTNYNPNAPTTPANTPFPAGSLQNWGNAVRIRHAGGFTSWYFHIKTNGVLVNVGDQVEQGQPIAISDNTGRSSGPHLHFQVQADSNNWGQSVAISFQNCQVPTGGSSVTSNNANPKFP